MAVSFVTYGSSAAANNAAITPAVPSGLQAGDFMVAILSIRENGATGFTGGAGWTHYSSTYAGSVESWISVFYREWQSGDSAPTFTPTGAGSNDTTLGQIFAFRGVDLTSPFTNTYSHTGQSLNSNSIQVVNSGPLAVGDMFLLAFHIADESTTSATNNGKSSHIGSVNGNTEWSTLGADATQGLLAGAVIAAAGSGEAYLSAYTYAAASPPAGILGMTFGLRASFSAQIFSYSGDGGAIAAGSSQTAYEAYVPAFEYSASGGAIYGGAATTSIAPYGYEPSGGGVVGGAASCNFQRPAIAGDAAPVVRVIINGVAYPAEQITLRRDGEVDSLLAQIVGKIAVSTGQACSMSVDYVQGGAIVAQVAAFAATVTESRQSGRNTTITAKTSATIEGGNYEPYAVQVRGYGMVRGSADFRVRPGNNYLGAIVRSVTTTLGVKTPWFTEVRF